MAENFKTDFFTDRIGRGIQDIFQAQLDIATKRIYQKGSERKKVQGTGEIIQGRSGALMAALQNPNYSVVPDGEGVIARSNLPLYTRFLDMKNTVITRFITGRYTGFCIMTHSGRLNMNIRIM